jgi:predicted nucleic acid-binding protein
LKIVFDTFDTNMVLDVLLIRKPYAQRSMTLFDAVVSKEIEGYLCATTITTIDYLVSKFQGRQRARTVVAQLLAWFSVAEVNAVVWHQAVNSDFSDFEDAVWYQAGVFMNVDGLVTRNQQDFKSATLPVDTPDEWLAILPNFNL